MLAFPRRFIFLLFLFGSGLTSSEVAMAQLTLASIDGVVRITGALAAPGAKVVLHRLESTRMQL